MSPNETLFLESTNKIIKEDISNSSFVRFAIWDFPGQVSIFWSFVNIVLFFSWELNGFPDCLQVDFFDSAFDFDLIFGGCGAIIFVIDAQVNLNCKFHQYFK